MEVSILDMLRPSLPNLNTHLCRVGINRSLNAQTINFQKTIQEIRKVLQLFICISCLTVIHTASPQQCPSASEMKTYTHARGSFADILLVAFFDLTVSPSGSCDVTDGLNLASIQQLEAVRWVFQKLNGAGYTSQSITLRAYDTPSPDLAVKGLRHLFSTVDNQYSDISENNDSSVLFGIIGSGDSPSAYAMSTVLSIQSYNKYLIQISPSATAPDLIMSPEHRHFYSLAPPDSIQARIHGQSVGGTQLYIGGEYVKLYSFIKPRDLQPGPQEDLRSEGPCSVRVIMEVVKKRGWNYVALLYSSDLYGNEGASVITSLAPSYHTCLVAKEAVSSGYSDVNKALMRIVQLFYSEGGAIIVFASQSTADQVIRVSADLEQLQNIEYIFSEAVTLQKSVFQDGPASSRLKTTPGSLIITPVHFAIEDFQSHWSEVIGNSSYARELGEYNPWLLKAHEYINQNPATSDEYHNTTIYTLYAIKTAYLYASIIKDWLDSQPSISTESPLSSDVIEYINRADISFSTNDQFPYIPRELVENRITIKFEDYRFPVEMSNADYDVYNIQLKGNEAYVKEVGKYRNGQLEMDIRNIKSYDKDKNEIAQSSLVSGFCPNGQKCEECLKSPVDSRWIYIPGDIIVVAAIPLYRGSAAGNCDRTRIESGFQFAEAVQFAVDTVNKGEGIFNRWFRDSQGNRKKVGALLLNTCYNRFLAQKSVYSLFKGTDPALPDWEVISKKVVGLVGGMGSSVSMAMAVPLTDLHIVQVSYASTSLTLKDRNTYPYFARTCAPDDKQVYVIIQMLKQLNWRYLTVIRQNDAYGRAGSAALRDLAAKEGIGISTIHEVSTEGDTDYFKLYDQLALDSNVKVVMLFTRGTIAEDILKNFEIKDPTYSSNFIFIGSESWGNRDFVIQSNRYGLGSITLLQDLPTNTQFSKYLDGLTNTDLELAKHRWWLHYWERRMECSWKSSYNRQRTNVCSKSQNLTKTGQFSQDPWAPFVINAVYSLLSGAHETLSEFCLASMKVCPEYRSNPHTMYQNVIKTTLPINQKDLVPVFDENGEGVVGYKIYHVVRDRSREGKLAYKQVGIYNDKDGLTIAKESLSFRGYDGIPSFKAIETDSTANENASGEDSSNGLLIIMAALVPSIILLIIIAVILFCFYKIWKKNRDEKQKTDEYLTVTPEYDVIHPSTNSRHMHKSEAPKFESIDDWIEESHTPGNHTITNDNMVVAPYCNSNELRACGDSGYIEPGIVAEESEISL